MACLLSKGICFFPPMHGYVLPHFSFLQAFQTFWLQIHAVSLFCVEYSLNALSINSHVLRWCGQDFSMWICVEDTVHTIMYLQKIYSKYPKTGITLKIKMMGSHLAHSLAYMYSVISSIFGVMFLFISSVLVQFYFHITSATLERIWNSS